jgi:outer membrane protein, heavy metal efflux system
MSKFPSSLLIRCTAWFGALVLSGCATYHPKALPTVPDLARSLSLTVPTRQFWLPGLKPHPFPTDGLDETAVVTLAVFNNPDLKAARLQAGVASAQLLEAGLLPDPQLNAGFARSSLLNGYDLGLSEGIRALITRDAAKAGARAHQEQVHLEILWQEWQVAGRARELFIQARTDDQLQPVLTATRDLLANHYDEDEAALKQGDLTLSTVSADLTVLVAADKSLRQLQLDANLTRHELDQLVGLKPDEQLHLIGQSKSQLLSEDQFQAAIATLPHRRADLLALEAGYQSQEQRLRQAILAQFPSLSAGVEQARGAEEGVHTIGFTVTLTLPIFNRNRGQIAVQQATRAVLHDTYQARLDQAVGDGDQVWKATDIMAGQLRDLDTQLPVLERTATAAEQSFRQGDLDASAYVNLKSSLLTEQAEAIRLHASLDQAKSALDILLGLPFGT